MRSSKTHGRHESKPTPSVQDSDDRQAWAGDRLPSYFGESSPRLFGCYHPAPAGTGGSPVAVLCPPVGQEYVRAHRTCLQLAIRLVRAGVPTLRFDYRGVGDSGGRWEESGLDDWVEDARRAIDHARACAGREDICLIGLRLGADIAALSARGLSSLAGVVLWDPAIDGGMHLKELEGLHTSLLRRAYVSAEEQPADAPVQELLGFRFGERLRSDLLSHNLVHDQLDMSCPILMIESGSTKPDGTLYRMLERKSEDIETAAVGGPQVWREDPYRALVPNEALVSIVSWVQRKAGPQ